MIGFPEAGEFTPTLVGAIYGPVRIGRPVAPSAVTAEQALLGDCDATLVEIDGEFIGTDPAAKDPTIDRKSVV